MKEMELSALYETLLMVPGMNDNVKVDLRIPRKTVLLLVDILQSAIHNKGNSNWLFSQNQESISELTEIINHCLEKAGLEELNTKLTQMRKSQ